MPTSKPFDFAPRRIASLPTATAAVASPLGTLRLFASFLFFLVLVLFLCPYLS